MCHKVPLTQSVGKIAPTLACQSQFETALTHLLQNENPFATTRQQAACKKSRCTTSDNYNVKVVLSIFLSHSQKTVSLCRCFASLF